MKFLGSFIDKNLSWKKHLTFKSNQIVKVISIISRLKHTVSSSILKTIYNALILPHISYSIVSWGNLSNREITRLKTLQKKAVRLINRAKYNSHTDPLFQSSGILKIDDIYKIECIKLYLKNRKNLLPNYLSQQLIANNEIHTYNTRQTDDIHNRTIRSRLEEQLLNTKISKVWNNLPNSIKELSSISRLKQYFLSLYQINCNILNCYICNR